MFISSEEENKIDAIIEQMWKFNHTYTLAIDGGNAEDREPYWYIRDEFGSAIEHSNQANARMAPFLSLIDGQMYTLLWLIEDIKCNGMCLIKLFLIALFSQWDLIHAKFQKLWIALFFL
jgi:tubulin--tyrosine ligase-like protein 12